MVAIIFPTLRIIIVLPGRAATRAVAGPSPRRPFNIRPTCIRFVVESLRTSLFLCLRTPFSLFGILTLHQCPHIFIPLPPTLHTGRGHLHESPVLQFVRQLTQSRVFIYHVKRTVATLLTVGEKVASAIC